MLFANKIRRLREVRQLLQRQLAAALENDTPIYSKIERGDRPAKREQVIAIAKILTIDKNELLTLWLADKILDVIENEKELANKALDSISNNSLMSDLHDKATRSYNLSRIRNKDTKPEMLVRKFLFANGFRYRLNDRKLPSKRDIVLPKYKTIIFINGCFWHGHENCKYFKLPATRTEWRKAKIDGNIKNDIIKHTLLRDAGYKVIVIWECEVKNKEVYNYIIDEIKETQRTV